MTLWRYSCTGKAKRRNPDDPLYLEAVDFYSPRNLAAKLFWPSQKYNGQTSRPFPRTKCNEGPGLCTVYARRSRKHYYLQPVGNWRFIYISLRAQQFRISLTEGIPPPHTLRVFCSATLPPGRVFFPLSIVCAPLSFSHSRQERLSMFSALEWYIGELWPPTRKGVFRTFFLDLF